MIELCLSCICWPLILKKRLLQFLTFFLHCYKAMKKKTYNMFSLMSYGQGLKVFILCLRVGREQGVSIVEKYDGKTLYLMLLKCYHYLHLVGKSCKSQRWWLGKLHIFQMTNTNCEHAKKLVTIELLNFWRCHKMWRTLLNVFCYGRKNTSLGF